METQEVFKFLETEIKILQKIKNSVNKIIASEQNPLENLDKIRASIKEIEKNLYLMKRPLDKDSKLISEFLEEYKLKEQSYSEALKKSFGLELEKILNKYNLPLTGHYPMFKVGIFTIEVNLNRFTATIWYGPKQEKLAVPPLIPSKIVEQLINIRDKLGSGMKEEDLFEKLREAYIKISDQYKQEEVLLSEVHKELQSVLQLPKYDRSAFSYDLFRLRSNKKIKLRVAVRAYTRKRTDFLWIPSDESGEGAFYSHIQVEVN